MSSDYSKQLGQSRTLIKISDVDAIASAQGINLDLADVYNSTFREKNPDAGTWKAYGSGAPNVINSGHAVPIDVLDNLLTSYIPRTYNPDLLAASALSSSFQAIATGQDRVEEAKLLSQLKVKDFRTGKISLYVPPYLKGHKQGGPAPSFEG